RPGFRFTYAPTASRYGASLWSGTVGRLAAGVLGVRVPPFLRRHLALDVDVLGLLEGLEALAAELATQPGLLEATEPAGVVVSQGVVEPDRARLDLAHAPQDGAEVLGVDVRAEAVGRRVSQLDRLVEALHWHQRGDRAEGLLAEEV